MRDNVSKGLRFEIFKRDGFTCQYCGRKPPTVILHADHILPCAEGGKASEDNLVTACDDCNLGKGVKLLDRVLVPMGISFEERREKLDQLRAYQDFLSDQQLAYDQWTEQLIEFWAVKDGQDKDAETWSVHRELQGAIKKFIRLLPAMEIMDAMRIAWDRFPNSQEDYRFRFFCGVCWKKIRANEGKPNVCETIQPNP